MVDDYKFQADITLYNVCVADVGEDGVVTKTTASLSFLPFDPYAILTKEDAAARGIGLNDRVPDGKRRYYIIQKMQQDSVAKVKLIDLGQSEGKVFTDKEIGEIVRNNTQAMEVSQEALQSSYPTTLPAISSQKPADIYTYAYIDAQSAATGEGPCLIYSPTGTYICQVRDAAEAVALLEYLNSPE